MGARPVLANFVQPVAPGRFAEEDEVSEYVSQLASDMHVYPIEHAVAGSYLYEDYDPDLVRQPRVRLLFLRVAMAAPRQRALAHSATQEKQAVQNSRVFSGNCTQITSLLASMTPGAARIDVQTHTYEQSSVALANTMAIASTGEEPWFGIPYTVARIPPALLQRCAALFVLRTVLIAIDRLLPVCLSMLTCPPIAVGPQPSRPLTWHCLRAMITCHQTSRCAARRLWLPLPASRRLSDSRTRPGGILWRGSFPARPCCWPTSQGSGELSCWQAGSCPVAGAALPRPPAQQTLACTPCRLWHKMDAQFRLPRAAAYFRLCSHALYHSPRAAALSHLTVKLLEDALCEAAYLADVAGLHYNIWFEGLPGERRHATLGHLRAAAWAADKGQAQRPLSKAPHPPAPHLGCRSGCEAGRLQPQIAGAGALRLRHARGAAGGS
jgi:hypothetical protein